MVEFVKKNVILFNFLFLGYGDLKIYGDVEFNMDVESNYGLLVMINVDVNSDFINE